MLRINLYLYRDPFCTSKQRLAYVFPLTPGFSSSVEYSIVLMEKDVATRTRPSVFIIRCAGRSAFYA